MIRTTDADWEQGVRDALAAGGPFAIACHDDPVVRLDALIPDLPHGPGNHVPTSLRAPLRDALLDAYAEGHTWTALATRCGWSSASHARYFAGLCSDGMGARWYKELAVAS